MEFVLPEPAIGGGAPLPGGGGGGRSLVLCDGVTVTRCV